MKRALPVELAFLLFGGFLFSITAQEDTSAQAQAMTDASLALVQLSSFVDTNAAFCAQHAPEAGVSDAAAAWYASSGLALLKTLEGLPEVAPTFGEMRDAYTQATRQTLAANATGREAEWCASVPALLQSPEWDVQSNYPDELARLGDIFTLITGDDPPQPLPQAQTLPPVTSPSYADVVAAGLDPETQFIQDEFRCYDTSGVDYSRPQLVVQITAPGQYLSSYGGGTFTVEDAEYTPDITWTSGPLKDAGGSLYFGDYGQSFSPYVTLGEERYTFECFQQGARERQALAEFRLRDPQPGTYQCQDVETGQTEALELLPGLNYTLGGQRGTYSVTDVLDDSGSSQISWLSGPLAESDASYLEEEGTGYREVSMRRSEHYSWFGSSSSLSVVCSAVGEPVVFARYGDGVAPPVQGNEQALSGFFYRYEYVASGMTGGMQPAFYLFFPSGYVHTGDVEGDPADIDCSRTKPNGAPYCETYRTSRNFLSIGESDPVTFGVENGVPVLDGEAMYPVVSGITSLDGDFWANYFWSMGFCMGEYSSCSSTYLEWEYIFTPEGRFEYGSSNQSLMSSNFGDMGGVNAGSSGSDYESGGYTIEGNTIELRFDNGKVEKKFIMITDPEHFVMGNQVYTPKERE